jgi:hypothetical protein
VTRLAVDVDVWSYIRHGTLVIPAIEVNKPLVSEVVGLVATAFRLR